MTGTSVIQVSKTARDFQTGDGPHPSSNSNSIKVILDDRQTPNCLHLPRDSVVDPQSGNHSHSPNYSHPPTISIDDQDALYSGNVSDSSDETDSSDDDTDSPDDSSDDSNPDDSSGDSDSSDDSSDDSISSDDILGDSDSSDSLDSSDDSSDDSNSSDDSSGDSGDSGDSGSSDYSGSSDDPGTPTGPVEPRGLNRDLRAIYSAGLNPNSSKELGKSERLGLDPLYSGVTNCHGIPSAQVAQMKVPFHPNEFSIKLSSQYTDDHQVLQASIDMGNNRHTCVYAMNPKSRAILFLITRLWSVPGKGMIVGGRSIKFPAGYNWNLGNVINSGERTGVWVCEWPKHTRQLSRDIATKVVDIVVDEDDYWFGLR